MGALTKLITGTAIGAGVIALASYAGNIRRAQVHLEVTPQASLHSIGLNGIKIRVNALLKNPTGASFSVKFPYLKMSFKDKMLGSSQVVDKDIKIAAYGQVMIDSMMVEIPVTNFLSVGWDVVKALNSGQPIVLTVEILTTIDLGWSKLPYDSKQEITIKK